MKVQFAKNPDIFNVMCFCAALKTAAIQTKCWIPAQCLHLIAVYAISCLDQIYDTNSAILSEFAPDMPTWPVLFLKKAQIEKRVVPRLNKLAFATRTSVGQGGLYHRDPTFDLLMNLITSVEMMKIVAKSDIQNFWFQAIPDDLFEECRSLPKLNPTTVKQWWKPLKRLFPYRYKDPVEHEGLLKLVCPRGIKTKKDYRYRSEIYSKLLSSLKSLIGRKSEMRNKKVKSSA